ncbi:MAG TPA: M1 family aminopeptidase [Candidatus Polarisedimenticolaceae bacterium]|nr:M1 family aminopeptidase [Candidatus Polarisedimenticolaceae bacterium]
MRVANRAVVHLIVCSCASAALADAPPASSPSSLSEASLGESCVVVPTGRLAQGNFEIQLAGGTVCPLILGSAKAGWFYAGNAKFRYVSHDPVEYPVLRFNAKTEGRVDVADVEGGVAIDGTAATILWATSGEAPPLAGDGASPPVEAIRNRFRDHSGAFEKYDGGSTARLVGAAMLDGVTPPTVRVEIGGGDGPLVYTYDAVDERSESLEILGAPQTDDDARRKWPRSTTLSEQPIGRDRRAPAAPAFLMTAADYELTATSGDFVSIVARTTIVPARERLRVLKFEIPGPILVRSGPGNSTERHYHVASVADAQGAPLAFAQENSRLLVDLGRAAAKDRPVTVVFRIEGDYLVRPGGDNYWILEGEELFPQPPFAGRQYTTHGVIRVKKPFRALASGSTVKRSEDGDDNVLEVRSELASGLVAVIAGNYQVNETSRDGLTVRVATYAGKNARSQEQLSELAFAMIDHMQRFLGPFPVPELNIVQVNDLGWGQAPLGMMLITNEAFERALPPDIAHFYTQGVNERFAHEIAHQWWGHALRWPGPEETWLSESFAEYSAGLMIKRAQGKGVFDNLKATWKLRAKNATRVAPIALANRISWKDPTTGFEDRFGLLYAKGPWLLTRLHEELGDEKFLTFLKSYQKTLHGKAGSTKLVADLLRVLSGKDYAPFFDANYWGTSMPE